MHALIGSAFYKIADIVDSLLPSARLARLLAIYALACQALLLILAVATDVMLYADGAPFAFGIALGDAWTLHWEAVTARFTVYALIVFPSEFISVNLSLSPMMTTKVYALIFFAVPILQFCIIMRLAWAKHSRLLIFPVLQYLLSNGFGYGFPSEALFSPGFMWICLFLIIRNQSLSASFFLSFLALCFTHEVAIPSALVIAVFASLQVRSKLNPASSRLALYSMIGLVLLPFLIFVLVQASGGAVATSSNAIYIIDPRRFLNNPFMWVMAVVGVLSAVTASMAPQKWLKLSLGALIVLSVITPFLLASFFDYDFVTGRYSAARSYIGGFMLILLSICILYLVYKSTADPAHKIGGKPVLAFCVSVLLAVSLASNVSFLNLWNTTKSGLVAYIEKGAPQSGEPNFEAEIIDFGYAVPPLSE